MVVVGTRRSILGSLCTFVLICFILAEIESMEDHFTHPRLYGSKELLMAPITISRVFVESFLLSLLLHWI